MKPSTGSAIFLQEPADRHAAKLRYSQQQRGSESPNKSCSDCQREQSGGGGKRTQSRANCAVTAAVISREFPPTTYSLHTTSKKFALWNRCWENSGQSPRGLLNISAGSQWRSWDSSVWAGPRRFVMMQVERSWDEGAEVPRSGLKPRLDTTAKLSLENTTLALNESFLEKLS